MVIFGGAAGDRLGQRTLMLRCYGGYLIALTTFAFVWHTHVPVAGILVGYTVLSATLTGFGTPSESVFVRQLVPDARVPRMMSISTTLGLVTRLAGPAAGAALIGWVGMSGSAIANAATDALLLVVLWRLRPRYAAPPQSRPTGGTREALAEGLRALRSHTDTRALLAALSLFAGAFLPLSTLLIPLLAHQRGWAPGQAGALVMASTAGSLTISAALAIAGPYRRPIIPMVAGVVLATASQIGLGLGLPLTPRVVCAYLCGLGIAAFSMHLGPLFVLRTPRELQSRFSALLTMAQMLPVMVTSLALGPIGQHLGATTALIGAAGLGCLALIPLLASPDLRRAVFEPRGRTRQAAATTAAD
jgi:MFS family permease